MRIRQQLISAVLTLMLCFGLVLPLSTNAVSAPVQDTSSLSIEQIEALISKLQKQLDEMKKGAKCFVSDKSLSLGDGEGDDGLVTDVRRLQEFLREKGHLKAKSTGYFGKLTRTALQTFQRSVGVEQNGEFDTATRQKTHTMTCKKIVAEAIKKSEVKAVNKESVSTSGVVRSILLKGDGRIMRWSTDGFSAMGFKVVWSKNSGPTYPNREGDRYQYLDSSSASETKLEAFDGSGTYFVRVCEYLGGSCGSYSNEVKVQL